MQAAIDLNFRFGKPMCVPSYCFFVFQTAAKPFERLPQTFKAACTHPLSLSWERVRERAHPDGQRKIQRQSMAYRRHTHSQKAACTRVRRASQKPSPQPSLSGGGSRLPKPRHWLHKSKKQPALSEFGSAGCFFIRQTALPIRFGSFIRGTAASDIRA